MKDLFKTLIKRSKNISEPISLRNGNVETDSDSYLDSDIDSDNLTNSKSIESINKNISDVSDILHGSMSKLLNRGENLSELDLKAESLKKSADLFKKRTKKLENLNVPEITRRRSSDYRTENETINIDQYEKHLMSLINDGNYQYVLEKSAQLGLTNIFKIVLDKSKKFDIHLKIDEALKIASSIGHYEIVELIIDEDLTNETYYNKKPRPSITEFYPFYEGQHHIPFTNIPLTLHQIKDAINLAIMNRHKEINILLSNYFLKVFDWKESSLIRSI